MGHGTRDVARRELERAAGNIDWAGQHVNMVECTYRELHPEIADPCLVILNALAEIQDAITKIRMAI